MIPPADSSPVTSSFCPTVTAFLLGTVLGFAGFAGTADAQSLQGSSASLDRQNAQAGAHGFSYLRTPDQVGAFVENGYLVPLPPSRDLELHQVSFPYTRPEVRVFLERFAGQYRSACGEPLVVTSLTRPISNQPVNASSRSVHPTGMAVDLRRSGSARCRQWLESNLLALEAQGLLEVIYERNPPHYHLAVYPEPYAQYLAARTGTPDAVAQALGSGPTVEARWVTHSVGRGENLSSIATRYGSSVNRIRSENGIRGDRLMVGQQLRIPVYETVPGTRMASAVSEAPANANEPEPVAPARSDAPSAATTTSATRIHSVARGESLSTIARRYGVSQEALRRANGLTGSRILVGEQLSIPVGDGAPAGNLRHRVARGESLWTISRSYGVSENELRVANGIQGSRILVGQELTIPSEGAAAGILQYTVQRGDSLWNIATRHGTTVDQIRRTNGMNDSRIHPGQVLTVPVAR